MTVPNTNVKDVYPGTGSQSVFPYAFRIAQAADLLVQQFDASGVPRTLGLGVDYTVSGVQSESGGNVTLTAGNLPTGYHLVILNDPSPLQGLGLSEGGQFSAVGIMRALDLLTRQSQAMRDRVLRTLRVPSTESPADLDMTLPGAADRANKMLVFDPVGKPIVVTPGGFTPGGGSGIAINPKDFGAKGDGVTNDSAAFQKCLNALFVAGGGELQVPPGTYFLDQYNVADCGGTVLWDSEFNSTTIPCLRAAGGTRVRGMGDGSAVKLLFRGSRNVLTYQPEFAVQGGILLSGYGTIALYNTLRGDVPVVSVVRDLHLGCGIEVADVSAISVAGPLAVGDQVAIYRPGQFDPDPNPDGHAPIPAAPIFRTPSREPSPLQIVTIREIDTVGNKIYFVESFLHDFETVAQLVMHIDRRYPLVRGISFENLVMETDLTTISTRGTFAVSNGSESVVGTGTAFTEALATGALVLNDPSKPLWAGGQGRVVASVEDDTHLTVTAPYSVDAAGVKIPMAFTDMAFVNVNQAFDVSFVNCTFRSMMCFVGTFNGIYSTDCTYDGCGIVGFENGHGLRIVRPKLYGRGDTTNVQVTGLYLNDSIRDAIVDQPEIHDVPTVAFWATHGSHVHLRDPVFVNCATYAGPPTDFGFDPNVPRYDAIIVAGSVPVFIQFLKDHMLPLHGTYDTTSGSRDIVGTDTKFLTECCVGGKLPSPVWGSLDTFEIDAITDDTHMHVSVAMPTDSTGNTLGCVAFLRRQIPEGQVLVTGARSYGPARTIVTGFNAWLTMDDCEFEIDNPTGQWEFTHREGAGNDSVETSEMYDAWPPLQLGESGEKTGDATFYPNGHQGRWKFRNVNIKPTRYSGSQTRRPMIATTYGYAGPFRAPKAHLAAALIKDEGVDGPVDVVLDSVDQISTQDLIMFDDPTGPYLLMMGKGVSGIDPATKTVTVIAPLNGTNDSNAAYNLPIGTPVSAYLGDLRIWSRIDADGLTWDGEKVNSLAGWSGAYKTISNVSTEVAPGTWQADHAYAFGDVVNNGADNTIDGDLYVCIKAGTSAGSGGPTGTGTALHNAITDGTVTWAWISTATDPGHWSVGTIDIPLPDADGDWNIDVVAMMNDGVHLNGTWVAGRSAAGATYDYVTTPLQASFSSPVLEVTSPNTEADGWYSWAGANRRLFAVISGGTVKVLLTVFNDSFAQMLWRIRPIARATLTPT